MQNDGKNYFKFALIFISCLLARLIPLRVPNVEPIMGATMPLSRAFGALPATFFAITSILLYDLATHTIGAQTFFTVFAYGTIGLWSASYFKKREANISNFVRFSIIGTLFFDAVTGLSVGPIFFHQSLLGSIVGQIPFTLLHLSGNIIFAIILSPAIYKLLIRKRKREKVKHVSTLNPKLI